MTTEAVALRAPANAYESLAATTIKMRARESIEIGMRAINPGTENLRAPGKRKRVM
jgi:hypothetical protein